MASYSDPKAKIVELTQFGSLKLTGGSGYKRPRGPASDPARFHASFQSKLDPEPQVQSELELKLQHEPAGPARTVLCFCII